MTEWRSVQGYLLLQREDLTVTVGGKTTFVNNAVKSHTGGFRNVKLSFERNHLKYTSYLVSVFCLHTQTLGPFLCFMCIIYIMLPRYVSKGLFLFILISFLWWLKVKASAQNTNKEFILTVLSLVTGLWLIGSQMVTRRQFLTNTQRNRPTIIIIITIIIVVVEAAVLMTLY